MKKRAGILTFHRARNIGTCLQAYAFQTYLESQKIQSEFIDYRPQYIEDSFGIFVKSLYREAKKNWKTLFIFAVKTIIKIPFNYKREKAFEKFRQNYLKISNLEIDTKAKLKETTFPYDFYFFGSDQIWKPDLTEGVDLSFFGDFVGNNGKKISYAASIGKNELNPLEMNRLLLGINFLDAVGVREKSAAELLQEKTDKKVFINIDPTLLIDKEIWIKFIGKKRISEKYILVYVLEINKELIDLVRKIAEKKDLKVVYLDMKNYYGKRGISRYSAGPEEFLNLIYFADYVITNSFHGTVFSVIFEKQFFSVPHKSRSTRVVDLLSELGIPERLIYTAQTDKNIDEEIRYSQVKSKLKIMRQKSETYLADVLEVKRH